MAAASLDMGVDWVWDMPDWAKLQHLLLLATARVSVDRLRYVSTPTDPHES